MSKKMLIFSGVTGITTVIFVIAYIAFSVLNITQPDVRKYEFTVHTESMEKVYDGELLENDNWSIQSGSIRSDHTLEYTMDASITIPGSITNDIGITIYDDEGYDVTNIYDIEYDLGTLEVKHLELAVQTQGLEKIYDGNVLESYEWNISRGSVRFDHRLVFTMNAEITTPGSIENAIGITIFDASNTDVTSYYAIDYDIGALTVLHRELSIWTEGQEKVYDGDVLESHEWNIQSGSVADRQTLEYVMNASITTPGSIENAIGITIFDDAGYDVTIHYNIEYDIGMLTVNYRELSIETETLEKIYDSNPLSNEVWSLLSGTVAENHRLEFIMNASITTPGTIDNAIGITIYDQDENDVTNNYHIDYDIGTLTVHYRELSIQTESLEKFYDGDALTSEVWTILSGIIADTHNYVAVMNASVTTPETIDNAIGITIYDTFGNDVTRYYDIEYDIGTLTVHYIELSIQTESLEKLYDGEPITSQGWIIHSGAVLSNHTLNFVMSATITNPGMIDNTIGITIFNEDEEDITSNYNIVYDTGSLVVNSIELSIQTESLEKIYDANPLTSDGWVILSGAISSTYTLEYVMNESITTPGSIDNAIGITIFNENGIDITNKYIIDYDIGTLTVHAIELSIETESVEKIYDGETLSSDEWIILSGAISEHHTLEYVMNAEITTPGIVDNTIDISIYDELGNNITSNYIITYDIGTLSVLYRVLSIETESVEKIYDGVTITSDVWTMLSGTIADAHTLEVVMEAEITTPGSIENEIRLAILDEQGNDVIENYEITYDIGTLTVLYRELSIETETLEKIYDGITLSSDVWEMLSGTIADAHTLEIVVDSEITTPGSIDNEIRVTILDEQGNDVIENYDITYTIGTLTIFSREMTIHTETLEKFYDSEELTSDTWTILNGTVAETHTLSYIMNASITIPGTVDNVITIIINDENNIDVTENYTITYEIGTLTVNFIELSVQTETVEKIYDGVTLVSDNWVILSGAISSTHTLEYIMTAEITTPGTVDNLIGITIYDGQGNDVTKYYNIEFDYGTLTVLERELSIQTESLDKFYDGVAITSETYTILSGTIADTHTIVTVMAATITTPGSIENTIGITILDENNIDVTSNYAINYDIGTLTVHYIELAIQTESIEKIYDGIEITSDTWNILSGAVAETHVLNYVMNASITPPGSIDNTIGITILDEDQNDVTQYYNIQYDLGTLTILFRELTIQTETIEKIYDELTLTSETWSILSGTIADTHTLENVMNESITNAGSIENTIGVTILDELLNDVTQYYDVTYDMGILTVLKRDVTVSTESAEKVYDELSLTRNEWHIESGSVLGTQTLVETMNSSITDPGTIDNSIGITIFDESGIDVTNNYRIVKDLGTLTVHNRELVIQTESLEHIYNGETVISDVWSIQSGSLLTTYTLEYVMDASITNPGSVTNTIGVTIYDELGNDVSSKYTIEYNLGALTVLKRELLIQTETNGKIYDGEALISSDWSIQSGSLLDVHSIEDVMNASITNPGSIDNSIGVTIYDENSIDVSNYYDITYSIGTLAVTERELTIQTETNEKNYDGAVLTSDVWSIQSGVFVAGHRIEYTMNSSITNTGVVDNTIGITVFDDNDVDVSNFYDITYDLGTLTVTERELIIQTETNEKIYDGAVLTSDVWSIQSGVLVAGHRIEYTMNSSITNPGSINNTIGVTVFDDNDVDVSNFYDITYDLGTLIVTERELIIQTETNEKIYDDAVLTSDVWSIQSGVLVAGHRIEYTMNSSITNVGVVDNTIGITIYNENDIDITSYYTISYDEGTLTILPKELTIQTESAEKFYDGTSLTSDVWSIQTGSLITNHTITNVMDATTTNPGTIFNAIGITINDDSDVDVTSNYDITYDLGTLTVKQIIITLKSDGDSKIYDGTPLSNSNWEILHGTILAEHTMNVVMDTEITDVGSVRNELYAFVIDGADNNVTDFYDFEYVTGSLAILSNVFSSGTLSRDGIEISITDQFQFYSGSTGLIYFRGNSYGDYNYNGWDSGTVHDTNLETNPLNFGSVALSANGKTTYQIQIEYLREQISYLVPYYSSSAIEGMNDIYTLGDISEISEFMFVPYTYSDNDNFDLQGTIVEADELLYRQYVDDNYLEVPQSTKNVFLQLALDNNLDPTSNTVISDVKTYIQNAAIYNLDIDPIPDEVDDIAVYFLTESKEGFCQHFATAAVIMYRTLGIPARYVTGFVADSVSNDWVVVTSETAHAWVEVYIDGYGWMQVEVTGGSAIGVNRPEIKVIPKGVIAEYVEGKTISASDAYLQGFNEFLAMGYTYDITYGGELTSPGLGISTIASITIYDEHGIDVTTEFDILYFEGVLQMYLYEINFITSGDFKEYDGTELTNDNWILDGVLATGHYISEVVIEGSQTIVGISDNGATFIIYNASNEDVTSHYLINYEYGSLMVYPRYITIETESATKVFDGNPLTNDQYTITGSLADDHNLEIIIIGSQTSIGKGINTVDTVAIYNQGVNVSSNYTIKLVLGILTVTPNFD